MGGLFCSTIKIHIGNGQFQSQLQVAYNCYISLHRMINEVESVLQESHCEFHAQWNECATEVLMCNTRCNNIPPAVVHEKGNVDKVLKKVESRL